MGGACGKSGRQLSSIPVPAEEHECKIPLGIPRSRWEDNANMHLKVTGWSGDWINLA
jgi:hypothetical protein